MRREERAGLVNREPRGRLDCSVFLEQLVPREVRDSRARVEQLGPKEHEAWTDSPAHRERLGSPAVPEPRELTGILAHLVLPALKAFVDSPGRRDRLAQLAAVERLVYRVPLANLAPLDSQVPLGVVEQLAW